MNRSLGRTPRRERALWIVSLPAWLKPKTIPRHRPRHLHLGTTYPNGRAERAAGRWVQAYKQQGSLHLTSC
jgi:hypothetical protein